MSRVRRRHAKTAFAQYRERKKKKSIAPARRATEKRAASSLRNEKKGEIVLPLHRHGGEEKGRPFITIRSPPSTGKKRRMWTFLSFCEFADGAGEKRKTIFTVLTGGGGGGEREGGGKGNGGCALECQCKI